MDEETRAMIWFIPFVFLVFILWGVFLWGVSKPIRDDQKRRLEKLQKWREGLTDDESV